jgi:anhydro-N-acetylmuramic acid kinase
MARYIGVMSGTSMDAVDVALVQVDGAEVRLQAAASTDWPPTLRERLHSFASGGPLDASALAVLDTDTGDFLAEAVNRLLTAEDLAPTEVAAIGCHGQTVAHVPTNSTPTTLQLGDANRIAERTGITTINDFRRRDMAAGGQGAPLAPAFHAAMLHKAGETRVVLNLGGIANITVLPGDAGTAATGFDTGPANCLMDAWTRQHLGQPFDRDGAWAASAAPDERLLAGLLSDPYFDLPAPKSTGTQHFSHSWLQRRLAAHPRIEAARVQATLMALTVESIAAAIARSAADTRRVLVCGGGVRNRVLLERLRGALNVPVESTAAHGVDPEWMEAMAFAWLAQQTLERRAGNLPSVTGASGPRVLGAIHPA